MSVGAFPLPPPAPGTEYSGFDGAVPVAVEPPHSILVPRGSRWHVDVSAMAYWMCLMGITLEVNNRADISRRHRIDLALSGVECR